MRRLCLFLLFFLVSFSVLSQTTRVRGKVTDAQTGEALPFVSVYFKGTTLGTTTDLEGLYFLETRENVDELEVSFLGYDSQSRDLKPKEYNAFDFKLQPMTFGLEEVKVKPGENPAHAILKNVSKHKKINNPDKIESYFCNTYTKMELDITNVNPYFKNKRLQKNFGFVFEHMDTSVITGKAFLPVMISEASADYYYRKTPSLSREIVKASRISGIEEDYTLAQFTGHLHVNVNLYDNYVSIFGVRFASPLSDHGLMYYKYFLVDSLQIDGRKTYKIRFHPKNNSVPVMDGEVHIDSLSWGLQYANVKMSKGLNVNWIRHLVLENKYQLQNDTVWFPKEDKLFADFTMVMSDSTKMVSFLGHRQVNYSGVKLDPLIPREVEKMGHNVIIREDVLKNDENYWAEVRPYELSAKEKQIYNMVDSIKNVPLYQNIYTVVSTILGGYYDAPYVSIGPYYKLFSFNKLEGSRFQLGARTNTDFSKKLRLSGYAAYGTKDNKFKGGGGIEYVFKNLPTSKFSFSFKRDALQLGAGVNAFSEGNILSSVFSRGGKDRLSMVDQLDMEFEKEWTPWISNTLYARMRDISSSKYAILVNPAGDTIKSIKYTGLGIRTRFSKDEIVVRNHFDKIYMGSDYPILGLDFSMGIKGIMKNDYEYYRLEGNILYEFSIPPLGKSIMGLSGGKIFGKVPYPMLKLHEGNATFFYDRYAYSCMNYYEFASDMWASFVWEHHFKGFFLGKIPLMKKLKWREVFVFKGVIGSISDKNNGNGEDSQAVLRFPEGMTSVSKPYLETGVGIENIFRIFRVDAIWRLTHRHDKPGQDVQNFTINFSVHLNF